MLVSHAPKFVFLEVPRTGSRSLCQFLAGLSRDYKQWNHHRMTIPEDLDTSGYFVFAVVRNPFVREVSHYLYRRRKELNNYHHLGLLPFKEYLVRAIDIEPCQARMLAGKRVDRVLRYEDGLADQVRGLPFMVGHEGAEVPHINANPRYDFREFYDEEAARMVLDQAEPDFELYRYRRDSWR